MSSSPLYLAIVVVWLIVLVPMLLRRDVADAPPAPARRNDPEDDAGFEEDLDEFDPDDTDDPDRTQVLHCDSYAAARSRYADARDVQPDEDTTDGFRSAREAVPPRRYAAGRARIIARRRRRTSGLVLVLALTGAAVAMGLGPWWVLVPPTVLLAGHFALLREAARADAEQRAAEARRRSRRRVEARARHAAREAEVIELMARRNQVYDQYADAHLRAAGD